MSFAGVSPFHSLRRGKSEENIISSFGCQAPEEVLSVVSSLQRVRLIFLQTAADFCRWVIIVGFIQHLIPKVFILQNIYRKTHKL